MVARVKAKDRAEAGGNYFTSPKVDVQFISSGCLTFDLALGGGWAENRIANIVGDKSTGKTLLCIEAAANFVRKYPKARVKYREVEAAFDDNYAKALGMPLDAVDFGDAPLDTVEDLFEDLEREIARRSKQPVLYICDSLDALSDRAELARTLDEKTMGQDKAKKLSQMFRRIVRGLKHSSVTVIIVSQVRTAIGEMFGRGTTRAGGKALDFYASQVPYLSQRGKEIAAIRGIKRVTGVTIAAQLDKNKVGLPFREARFNIEFGYGIDDDRASLMFLKQAKRLKVAGYSNSLTDEEIKDEARNLGKDDRAAIRKAVTDTWWELEREFMPARRKYGDD